eukprot:TCONS_00015945-protein
MLVDDCLKCQRYFEYEFEQLETGLEDLHFVNYTGVSADSNETDYLTGNFNGSDFHDLPLNMNHSLEQGLNDFINKLNNSTINNFLNFTNTTGEMCYDLYEKDLCHEDLLEPSDIDYDGSQDYHHILPQIILAVIAMLLNMAEMHLMKKRKKYFPSELLMISLAVADFLFSLLVVLTLTLTLTYHNDGPTGRMVNECLYMLTSFSIIASILHVVGISIDRLIAVLFPLRHRVRTDAVKMKRAVFSIWLLTLAFVASISVYKYHRGLAYLMNDDSLHHKSELLISYTIFISCFIVALIYLIITRRLAMQASFLRSFRRSTSRHKQNKSRNNRRSKVETVALLTACIVTVSFLVCTLPSACLPIVNNVSNTIHTISLCFLVCNSICNPIVYFWRGYWLKAKRRKSLASALTDLSKSRSSTHSNTISTVARSAAVACIPIRDGFNVIGQSGKYDLDNMTVMDIFDFDSINRYRRFNRSYYNQNHEFIMSQRE